MSRSLGTLLRGAASAVAIAILPMLIAEPATAGYIFALNVAPEDDPTEIFTFFGSGFIDLPQETTCVPSVPDCSVDFVFNATFSDPNASSLTQVQFTESDIVFTSPPTTNFNLTWFINLSGSLPTLESLNLYTNKLDGEAILAGQVMLPVYAFTLQQAAMQVYDPCFHTLDQVGGPETTASGCQVVNYLDFGPTAFPVGGSLTVSNAIPQPGTLALVISGLIGLLLIGRRQNNGSPA